MRTQLVKLVAVAILCLSGIAHLTGDTEAAIWWALLAIVLYMEVMEGSILLLAKALSKIWGG